MNAIELEGQIDDAGRLVLDTPLPLPAGRVHVRVEAFETEEDDEAVYRAMVNHSWRESLENPAEDIYTIEDGWPIDPETGEIIRDAK